MGDSATKAAENRERFFELLHDGRDFKEALREVYGHNWSSKSEQAIDALRKQYREWLKTHSILPDNHAPKAAKPEPAPMVKRFVDLYCSGKELADIWIDLYPEMQQLARDALAGMAQAFCSSPDIQAEIEAETARRAAAAELEKQVAEPDQESSEVTAESLATSFQHFYLELKELSEQLKTENQAAAKARARMIEEMHETRRLLFDVFSGEDEIALGDRLNSLSKQLTDQTRPLYQLVDRAKEILQCGERIAAPFERTFKNLPDKIETAITTAFDKTAKAIIQRMERCQIESQTRTEQQIYQVQQSVDKLRNDFFRTGQPHVNLEELRNEIRPQEEA